MTATAEPFARGRAPRPSGGPAQGVRDSLAVAKRNLIRMVRIPDPVRSYRSVFISPRIRDQQLNALKEQVK